MDKNSYGVVKLNEYKVKLFPNEKSQIRNIEKMIVVYDGSKNSRSNILKSVYNNIAKGRFK